jgi:hypothetical protein
MDNVVPALGSGPPRFVTLGLAAPAPIAPDQIRNDGTSANGVIAPAREAVSAKPSRMSLGRWPIAAQANECRPAPEPRNAINAAVIPGKLRFPCLSVFGRDNRELRGRWADFGHWLSLGSETNSRCSGYQRAGRAKHNRRRTRSPGMKFTLHSQSKSDVKNGSFWGPHAILCI